MTQPEHEAAAPTPLVEVVETLNKWAIITACEDPFLNGAEDAHKTLYGGAASLLTTQAEALQEARAGLEKAREEVASLKSSVIAFCAPWAVTYAADRGLPKDHLHPSHYDLLASCGAHMTSFTRASLNTGARSE